MSSVRLRTRNTDFSVRATVTSSAIGNSDRLETDSFGGRGGEKDAKQCELKKENNTEHVIERGFRSSVVSDETRDLPGLRAFRSGLL